MFTTREKERLLLLTRHKATEQQDAIIRLKEHIKQNDDHKKSTLKRLYKRLDQNEKTLNDLYILYDKIMQLEAI